MSQRCFFQRTPLVEPHVAACHHSQSYQLWKNMRLFPMLGVKVWSSGMFCFIPSSREAFMLFLIRKKQPRKRGTGRKCLAFYFAMFMYRIRTSLIISFGRKKTKNMQCKWNGNWHFGHNLSLAGPVIQPKSRRESSRTGEFHPPSKNKLPQTHHLQL